MHGELGCLHELDLLCATDDRFEHRIGRISVVDGGEGDVEVEVAPLGPTCGGLQPYEGPSSVGVLLRGADTTSFEPLHQRDRQEQNGLCLLLNDGLRRRASLAHVALVVLPDRLKHGKQRLGGPLRLVV